MKTLGIVVEYNPLHNGHKYHFEEAKRITGSDYVIAVMSSSFVQRGEPAIINKEERVKLALELGVDLVIELPFLYTVTFVCFDKAFTQLTPTPCKPPDTL